MSATGVLGGENRKDGAEEILEEIWLKISQN